MVPTSGMAVTQESVRGGLPMTFAERVIPAVMAAYDEAEQQCSENFGPEGGDLRGHLLRALVERNVRQNLAGLQGVEVRSERNKALNCQHLVLTIGHLVITISAVESRGTLVRRAEFRESLAMSAQGDLFAAADAEPTGTNLYLLILHGPTGAQSPSFVDIVPPTSSCDAYVEHARLSLLDMARESNLGTTAAAAVEVVAPATAELLDGAAKEDKPA